MKEGTRDLETGMLYKYYIWFCCFQILKSGTVTVVGAGRDHGKIWEELVAAVWIDMADVPCPGIVEFGSGRGGRCFLWVGSQSLSLQRKHGWIHGGHEDRTWKWPSTQEKEDHPAASLFCFLGLPSRMFLGKAHLHNYLPRTLAVLRSWAGGNTTRQDPNAIHSCKCWLMLCLMGWWTQVRIHSELLREQRLRLLSSDVSVGDLGFNKQVKQIIGAACSGSFPLMAELRWSGCDRWLMPFFFVGLCACHVIQAFGHQQFPQNSFTVRSLPEYPGVIWVRSRRWISRIQIWKDTSKTIKQCMGFKFWNLKYGNVGCDIVSATKKLKGKISYIFLTILVFCVFTVDSSRHASFYMPEVITVRDVWIEVEAQSCVLLWAMAMMMQHVASVPPEKNTMEWKRDIFGL